MTRWADDIDPASPWPEYPRPDLVRDQWMSLNGLWDYAVTLKEAEYQSPEGKILVPYPIESALSGVKRRITDSLALWYSRDFALPRQWNDKQVILNFEASACMMLDYIEEKEMAARIRKAVATVIEEGRVRTYDMMKMTGKPDVVDQGAASTLQMTDAIIANLK